MIYNNLKFKVTPHKEHKQHILNGLKRNKTKFGKSFCPCVLTKDDTTVCHCEKFRLKGDCCCALFVIDVELNNNNKEGVMQYNSETNKFFGYVIDNKDYIPFEGNTIEEAKEDFFKKTF